MDSQSTSAHLLFSPELESMLKEFKDVEPGKRVVTPELRSIFQNIAETGVVCFDWSTFRVLVGFELGRMLKDSVSENEDMDPAELEEKCINISNTLEDMDGAPFTMQRICEVILSHAHYRGTKKLLFAIEKLLNVSTVMVREQNPKSWKPRPKLLSQ